MNVIYYKRTGRYASCPLDLCHIIGLDTQRRMQRTTAALSLAINADDASLWWRRLHDVTANCIHSELLTDIDWVSVHNPVRLVAYTATELNTWNLT